MRPATRTARTPAEWVTLAVSIIVVGSLLAIALIEESRLEDREPASLTMTFDTVASWPVADKYHVPFTVSNRGSEAVASADLWIEVYDEETRVESARITVQFLPLQGRQDGVYVSSHDPATHTFRGRLESVQFP